MQTRNRKYTVHNIRTYGAPLNSTKVHLSFDKRYAYQFYINTCNLSVDYFKLNSVNLILETPTLCVGLPVFFFNEYTLVTKATDEHGLLYNIHPDKKQILRSMYEQAELILRVPDGSSVPCYIKVEPYKERLGDRMSDLRKHLKLDIIGSHEFFGALGENALLLASLIDTEKYLQKAGGFFWNTSTTLKI